MFGTYDEMYEDYEEEHKRVKKLEKALKDILKVASDAYDMSPNNDFEKFREIALIVGKVMKKDKQ